MAFALFIAGLACLLCCAVCLYLMVLAHTHFNSALEKHRKLKLSQSAAIKETCTCACRHKVDKLV